MTNRQILQILYASKKLIEQAKTLGEDGGDFPLLRGMVELMADKTVLQKAMSAADLQVDRAIHAIRMTRDSNPRWTDEDILRLLVEDIERRDPSILRFARRAKEGLASPRTSREAPPGSN